MAIIEEGFTGSCPTCGQEWYGKQTSEDGSHFPLLLEYTDEPRQYAVVKSPPAIESGRRFVVLCTNIQIKE